MITVGQPIVLNCLVHSEDCSIPGFEGKKGERVVLPAPQTEERVQELLGIREQACADGREMRRLIDDC
jgi:hypothetical protein